jgi:hypothetical protein
LVSVWLVIVEEGLSFEGDSVEQLFAELVCLKCQFASISRVTKVTESLASEQLKVELAAGY